MTSASRLRGAGPLAVELAGERLVFFRGLDGRAGALLDRCPHRGVRLSLGRIGEDGCLECPFHAWRFDTEGRNRRVPFSPDARRERLGATSVPVRELGGLLWVYTAPTGPDAPAEPVLPDSLTRADVARVYEEVEWNAHWTRAMENMLDSPHVPFVHRTTIGRALARAMRPDSRMDITWEPTPYGGRSTAVLDGRNSGAWLDFYRPNMMVLNIPMPERSMRIHAIAVPVGARAVRMLIINARSFARLAALDPLFNFSSRVIAAQDRAVVESSDPVEAPPPGDERSVPTDRATLQFRKYYYDVLKHSSAAAVR